MKHFTVYRPLLVNSIAYLYIAAFTSTFLELPLLAKENYTILSTHTNLTINPVVSNLYKTEQLASESLYQKITVEQNTQKLDQENYKKTPKPQRNNKKKWTFLIYMAADNDLAPFARKNLKQLIEAGSTQFINIIVQLDTRTIGSKKITRRYYVKKGELLVVNSNDPTTQQMDSGIPSTLIDFCKWGIDRYPAENYGLVLWNHGTGALDIGAKRNINPFPLFTFNPETNLVELDRSIPFSDFVLASYLFDPRGICFDDTTGHYLTNQDLDTALSAICTNYLNKKKFSLICFDACLMSMIEIASIIKKHADYMVASQEVELGTGYDYQKILAPFEKSSFNKEHFAKHIVQAYGQTYSNITKDYTQSAVDLSLIENLEHNIHNIGKLLSQGLTLQKGRTVIESIKAARHKLFCTHFDEPSYIDLHHFYTNLLTYMKQFSFRNQQEEAVFKEQLKQLLQEGIGLITKCVIENSVGKNLEKAKGISIYFPERKLQAVYYQTNFAQTNAWSIFLKDYINNQ